PGVAALRCLLFAAPPAAEISTLSLHDALPICRGDDGAPQGRHLAADRAAEGGGRRTPSASAAVADRARRREEPGPAAAQRPRLRSEEHTSALQSRENLVCRLLLEKKKSQTREA